MERTVCSYLAAAALAGFFAIALTACGGQSSPSIPPGFMLPGANAPVDLNLPSPGELDKQASAPSMGDLRRSAISNSSLLPEASTSTTMSAREFTSAGTSGGGLTGLAYAGYQFTNMDGYDRAEGVSLFFETAPGDTGNVYIAVANFTADTWDWYSYNSSGYTPTPGFADYISSAGNTYVMVLLAGQDTMQLYELIVGERLDIYPVLSSDLSTDPSQNIAPQTVAFDASFSYVLGGTITSFDFDFDNDSVLDVTGDTDGLEEYTYTEPGAHACRVVVHDDGGQTAGALKEFWLVNPANVPPTAVIDASTTSGNAPLKVDLTGANSTDDTGITTYRWDMNSDGVFEYESSEPELTYTFSRGGANWVTLEVEDQDFAIHSVQASFLITGGFSLVEVASVTNVLEPMDIAMCSDDSWADDYATIAFQASPEKDLKVVKATNVSGMSWGPMVDAASTSKDTGFSPVLVKGAMQRPVVVYGEDTGSKMVLQAVWPGVAETQQYSVWNGPWTLDAVNDTGGGNAISERGGVLHVASISSYRVQGQQSLYYYRSNGSIGNSWNAPVLLKQGPAGGGFSEAAVSYCQFLSLSYPLVAYAQYDLADDELDGFGVLTTTYLDGSVWDERQFYSGYPIGYIGALQLGSSHPLVVAGCTSQTNSVMYSATATTTSGTTWPAEPLEAAERGYFCDVTLIGGLPAACFQDSRDKLQYITAVDASASAWNDAMDVDLHGSAGRYCAITERATGKPIIVYYESNEDKVKVATWL